ncbi:MAG: 4-hydroxybenzoate octaprenyltransferase [Burkholderiaceae bacterium]|nr:4-hydroxybenzoate octaprenyltransferase [Burkholderiaceae bacterium]
MTAVDPIRRRLSLYVRLIRLDKPVGTLLLLWPTLTALWIATDGRPPAWLVGIFVLGTLLTRSAGCAINDVADRDFDGHVKRTADRVVSSGALSPLEAVAVAVVLLLLAALLLIPLNALTFWLAVVGVTVATTYPFFKRFFPLPQAYLAIAFSFGIPMAFAAALGHVPAIGWWLFAANLFWVVAYDTEYAMVDRDDDIRIGLRSSAILFGRADVAAVMFCYGAHLSLLLVVGAAIGARWPFYLGWAAALGCVVYHYVLIRSRERADCFRAFRHNQWVGFAVFAGVALDYALR